MHLLRWYPGRPGKGLVDESGDVHTWPVFGPKHDPDHTVYQDKNKVNGHFYFQISPEGAVSNDLGYLNQFTHKSDGDVLKHITEADPNLHPVPTDQWMFNQGDGLALTSATEDSAPYLDELREWLKSLAPQEEEELSPHHNSPVDFIPTTEVVGATKKPPSLNPKKFYTTKAQHESRKRGKAARQQRQPHQAMAADPEWWENYVKHNPYLYHATHEDAYHDILSEGLLPWDYEVDDPDGYGHRSTWNDWLRPRPGHVYMGTQDKMEGMASGQGKDHILRVDLSQLDPSKINADEDSHMGIQIPYSDRLHGYPVPYYDDALRRVIPKEHQDAVATQHEANDRDREKTMDWMDVNDIPHEHSLGDWANRFGLNHPDHVKHSLEHFGTLAYDGEIPSHALEEHSVYPDCPECDYSSGGLYEDGYGKTQGDCHNCGWDSHKACSECQNMPSEDSKPLLCEHCGHNEEGWEKGDPIMFGTSPGMITKLTPHETYISTHGEEPWQVQPEMQGLIQPMHANDQYKYPWLDPQSADHPLNKWPEGYVRTVPLPGQEKLWYQDPAGEWTPQTWKDQAAWDETHQAQ